MHERRVALEDIGNPKCTRCRRRESQHRVTYPGDWVHDGRVYVRYPTLYCR